jgi:hypothetical protein
MKMTEARNADNDGEVILIDVPDSDYERAGLDLQKMREFPVPGWGYIKMRLDVLERLAMVLSLKEQFADVPQDAWPAREDANRC